MRDRLTVWQWAERYRFLARGVSARSSHGDVPYRTLDAPHQKEPQESFTDPAVQVTVLVMASQIGGKTEMVNNALGFTMHWLRTGACVMYPIVESAERYSKRKFTPMVNATPVLAELIAPARARNSGNTILSKDFDGGSVFFIGANSPASLRGTSGQLLIGDEVDSYEESAGAEGDPVELLWKRGESYPKVVKILASTPTIHGFSSIWNWLELSDFRLWFMPCVHCGKEIIFKWSSKSKLPELPHALMQWPENRPEDAYLVCMECSNHITDAQRLDMYHAGRWKPTREFTGIRGYHLNWLHCPWPAPKGFKNRLHSFASQWSMASKRGKDAVKALVRAAGARRPR